MAGKQISVSCSNRKIPVCLDSFDARGIACDIPSVIYQFIWEPAVWSKYYSEGHEILKYFQDTATKHGLNKYINLEHCVDHAQWLQEEGKWRVTVTNLNTGETSYDEGEVLINATGFLKYVA